MKNADAAMIYNNGRAKTGFIQNSIRFMWYALPFLVFMAVFAPAILSAYHEFAAGALPLPNPQVMAAGETPLRAILLGHFGDAGLHLFAMLPAAIMMFAIAKIAKLFDAPLWARVIAMCVMIVLPLFTLAPNLWERPDEAIFAALCALMAYYLIRAVRYSDGSNLGAAFFIAIILSFLHPISFWAQIMIFIIARITTPAFKKDAKYGLIISLIWGPGLFALKAFLEAYQTQNLAPSIKTALMNTLHNSVNIGDAAGNTFNFIGNFIGFLPLMLSFIVLLLLAILGLLFLLNNENRFKRHYYAAALVLLSFIIVAVAGGGLSLARLILDPLLLAFAAALAGIDGDKLRLFADRFTSHTRGNAKLSN